VKLYLSLIQDCPLYEKLPRVHAQLAAVYRRLGNFDSAYHHLL
jgi:hypothetical protein